MGSTQAVLHVDSSGATREEPSDALPLLSGLLLAPMAAPRGNSETQLAAAPRHFLRRPQNGAAPAAPADRGGSRFLEQPVGRAGRASSLLALDRRTIVEDLQGCRDSQLILQLCSYFGSHRYGFRGSSQSRESFRRPTQCGRGIGEASLRDLSTENRPQIPTDQRRGQSVPHPDSSVSE